MAAVDEPTTLPVDDDNNPVLLQQRVKKLTKKLKNERKAKDDLASRYQHLFEAFEGMMTALNKAAAVVAPQAPKKIDNTTDNKQFVDKSVAQKDVDSWMNIFAKKGGGNNSGSGPSSAPPSSASNPNLPTANSGTNLDRSSNNSSPAPRDRKSSAADLTVQPAAAATPSPAASPVVKKVQKQQGIDNTTDNKQFVDKNHAEKDIDSWMKIFKK